MGILRGYLNVSTLKICLTLKAGHLARTVGLPLVKQNDNGNELTLLRLSHAERNEETKSFGLEGNKKFYMM